VVRAIGHARKEVFKGREPEVGDPGCSLSVRRKSGQFGHLVGETTRSDPTLRPLDYVNGEVMMSIAALRSDEIANWLICIRSALRTSLLQNEHSRATFRPEME
jgi:hypothetical protein